jgi:hypothetical protein
MVKLVNLSFSSNSYYITLAVVFLFLQVILSDTIYPIQLLNGYQASSPSSFLLGQTELFKHLWTSRYVCARVCVTADKFDVVLAECA